MSINYKLVANVLAIVAGLCGASSAFLATVNNSAAIGQVLIGLASVLIPIAVKLFHVDAVQQQQPTPVEAQPASTAPTAS